MPGASGAGEIHLLHSWLARLGVGFFRWFRICNFQAADGVYLAANAEFRDIRLVTFLLHRLLRYGAQGLFVRILRRLAMAPNHLFARHDPYQPV